jgi:hypothetical protein
MVLAMEKVRHLQFLVQDAVIFLQEEDAASVGSLNGPSAAATDLSRELQAGLDDDFFILHRNRWTWKQMRRIRAHVVNTHERRIACAGAKRKGLAKQLQALADAACARMIHSSNPSP